MSAIDNNSAYYFVIICIVLPQGPGRVIRDLFRQLHAVWHGTEALVYSSHPIEAAAYLAIIFGRIAGGLPWLFPSTAVLMQRSHQCWR